MRTAKPNLHMKVVGGSAGDATFWTLRHRGQVLAEGWERDGEAAYQASIVWLEKHRSDLLSNPKPAAEVA